MNRIFQDLLSLHGYPLPYVPTESASERKAADAAAFGPRYGNRRAATRLFGAPVAGNAPADAVHGACTMGACG